MAPAHRRPRIARRHIQILLGALWLLDGALQLQPFMYRREFVTSVLLTNTTGQPAPIATTIRWAAAAVSQHLILANTTFALIQVLIGVGLLIRRTVRPAMVASALWGLAVWWVGEGFGMLLTGRASPASGAPGAVLLYVVIAMLVWPGGLPDRAGALDGVPRQALTGSLVWALLWCGSALLWLLPANRAAGSFHDALDSAAGGQPGWLSGLLRGVAHALDGRALPIALLLAGLSLAIGLGVFTARPIPFLAAGGVLSVTYWVFAQATDPGTAPLFILLALSLLPQRAAAALPLQRHSIAPAWRSA